MKSKEHTKKQDLLNDLQNLKDDKTSTISQAIGKLIECVEYLLKKEKQK